MKERVFNLENNDSVLHLPISLDGEKFYVKVYEDDVCVTELHIALSYNFDAYFPFFTYGEKVKSIKLLVEREDFNENAFDKIVVGEHPLEREDLYPNLYKEDYRQKVHFSPMRGWMNDPNGLVFKNGDFHFFFQHNPFGRRHGGVNVSWGRAISKDGVHFKEYPDAIRPTNYKNSIASGSAILDENNVLGFGKDTIICAFTDFYTEVFEGREKGDTKGQYIGYSTDNGKTFTRLTKDPVILSAPNEHWRDPKILTLDDGTFVIAVHELFEKKNCVSFYASKNLIDWEFKSRTMDLYECPDFFRLNVIGTNEKKWVLFGGNGAYRVGDFIDFKFVPESQETFYIDMALDYPYAGQTFNSYPSEDFRYYVAWARESEPDLIIKPAFSQSATIITKLSLHKTKKGYVIFREPIETLKTLRKGKGKKFNLKEFKLSIPSDTTIYLNPNEDYTLTANGHGFIYNSKTKRVNFSGGNYTDLVGDYDVIPVRIIVDARSIEYFFSNEATASYIFGGEKFFTANKKVKGITYALKSIWE